MTSLLAPDGQRVHAAPTALFEATPAGTLRWFNPAFEALFGPQVEDGMRLPIVDHSRDTWHHLVARARSDGGVQVLGGYLRLAADRSLHWVEHHLRWLEIGSPDLGVVVGAAYDLTEWKRRENELAWASLHDGLTGLANRTLFEERLRSALQALQRRGSGAVAVGFVDLDGFKELNDRHGHLAGDAVLVEVAHRLRRALRPGDVVARHGGDEFALLMPRIDAEGSSPAIVADTLADRLRAVLRRTVHFDGKALAVRASVGVVATHDPTCAGEMLLRRADASMYAVKARRSWRPRSVR